MSSKPTPTYKYLFVLLELEKTGSLAKIEPDRFKAAILKIFPLAGKNSEELYAIHRKVVHIYGLKPINEPSRVSSTGSQPNIDYIFTTNRIREFLLQEFKSIAYQEEYVDFLKIFIPQTRYPNVDLYQRNQAMPDFFNGLIDNFWTLDHAIKWPPGKKMFAESINYCRMSADSWEEYRQKVVYTYTDRDMVSPPPVQLQTVGQNQVSSPGRARAPLGEKRRTSPSEVMASFCPVRLVNQIGRGGGGGDADKDGDDGDDDDDDDRQMEIDRKAEALVEEPMDESDECDMEIAGIFEQKTRF